MAKAPALKFTTPKGVFKFPSISKPDYGTREYPCPDGQYKLKLVLKADSPEVRAFIEKLRPLHDRAAQRASEAFAALKLETRKKLKEVSVNPLYTELYDPDTEQPTGEIEFSFKKPASGVYKKGPKAGERWTRKLPVFDSKGNKPTPVPDAWGGTVGRVSFEVGTDFETGEPGYFISGTGTGGLKLALEAVQIIELATGGDRNAGGYGFGAEEGYEGSSEAEETGWTGPDASTEAAGDNDDF